MHSATPSSRQTVLVVCFGNLCRSPMADALLRAALPRNQWCVLSAGTHAIGGDPPTRGSRDAIQRLHGLDISHQRSSPLTVDLLRNSDFVFTMSKQQAMEAAALFPDAASNVRLLGAFSPATDAAVGPADPNGHRAESSEISDPMGGDEAEYTSCCRRLGQSVDAVAAWLRDGGDPGKAPASVATWCERP